MLVTFERTEYYNKYIVVHLALLHSAGAGNLARYLAYAGITTPPSHRSIGQLDGGSDSDHNDQ